MIYTYIVYVYIYNVYIYIYVYIEYYRYSKIWIPDPTFLYPAATGGHLFGAAAMKPKAQARPNIPWAKAAETRYS